MHYSKPSSLSPFQISNITFVTQPISSSTIRIFIQNFNQESNCPTIRIIEFLLFGCLCPQQSNSWSTYSFSHYTRGDKSDSSTIKLEKWMRFKICAPTLVPSSPTFNIVKFVTHNISFQNAVSVFSYIASENLKATTASKKHFILLSYPISDYYHTSTHNHSHINTTYTHTHSSNLYVTL